MTTLMDTLIVLIVIVVGFLAMCAIVGFTALLIEIVEDAAQPIKAACRRYRRRS
jgi:hypothetical protein